MKRTMGKPPFVHLAPPCSTYSVARWPRLRSSDHPHGLPKQMLGNKYRLTLKYANMVTKHTLELMLIMVDQGVPHSIEQPVGSLMHNEQIQKLGVALRGDMFHCGPVYVWAAIQETHGDSVFTAIPCYGS